MSKFSRVAKMGTSNSKYGTRRNEFEKDDRVTCGFDKEYTGIVVRSTSRTVIVNTNERGMVAFEPRFVHMAEED